MTPEFHTSCFINFEMGNWINVSANLSVVLSFVRPDAKLIFKVNKFDTSLLRCVTTMIYGHVNSSNRRWYKIMAILPRHMTQIQIDGSFQLSTTSIILCQWNWARTASQGALKPLFTAQNDRNISHWYFGKYNLLIYTTQQVHSMGLWSLRQTARPRTV